MRKNDHTWSVLSTAFERRLRELVEDLRTALETHQKLTDIVMAIKRLDADDFSAVEEVE